MTDIRAMAFDASGKIWACQGGSQVFLIDPIASTSVSQFTVAGCVDGLAYDGADDTIWASRDADNTIYHYSLGTPPNGPLGTLIASLGGLTAGSCGGTAWQSRSWRPATNAASQITSRWHFQHRAMPASVVTRNAGLPSPIRRSTSGNGSTPPRDQRDPPTQAARRR